MVYEIIFIYPLQGIMHMFFNLGWRRFAPDPRLIYVSASRKRAGIAILTAKQLDKIAQGQRVFERHPGLKKKPMVSLKAIHKKNGESPVKYPLDNKNVY